MAKSQSRKKSRRKRMKQKPINMVGCSKSHKHNKSCTNTNNSSCPNCGPNCHCGPNCNCPHNCTGNCYLNRRMKAGAGCGSTGCPVGGLTGGTRLIYTNNTSGVAYKPWTFSKLGGTEDTGYLNNSATIGGYKYSRGKHYSKKQYKSNTNKYKTFKHYKYKGGGLVSELINNFHVAANAIRGYPSPTDPTVYKDQLVNTGLRL
jgi:hypothetical protein